MGSKQVRLPGGVSTWLESEKERMGRDRSERQQVQIRITSRVEELLDAHFKVEGLNRSTWFELAATSWLDALARDLATSTILAAPSAASRRTLYVSPDLKDRLANASPGASLVDIYWTILVWYVREHGLLTSGAEATPVVLTMPMYRTQRDALDALVDGGTFETRQAFWTEAIEQWIKNRAIHTGPFLDYQSTVARSSAGDGEVEHVHAITSRELHALALRWAKEDGGHDQRPLLQRRARLPLGARPPDASPYTVVMSMSEPISSPACLKNVDLSWILETTPKALASAWRPAHEQPEIQGYLEVVEYVARGQWEGSWRDVLHLVAREGERPKASKERLIQQLMRWERKGGFLVWRALAREEITPREFCASFFVRKSPWFWAREDLSWLVQSSEEERAAYLENVALVQPYVLVNALIKSWRDGIPLHQDPGEARRRADVLESWRTRGHFEFMRDYIAEMRRDREE